MDSVIGGDCNLDADRGGIGALVGLERVGAKSYDKSIHMARFTKSGNSLGVG
jgi:hypothetical protein